MKKIIIGQRCPTRRTLPFSINPLFLLSSQQVARHKGIDTSRLRLSEGKVKLASTLPSVSRLDGTSKPCHKRLKPDAAGGQVF